MLLLILPTLFCIKLVRVSSLSCSDLRGKAFSLWLLSVMLTVGLPCMVFIKLRYVPSMPLYLKLLVYMTVEFSQMFYLHVLRRSGVLSSYWIDPLGNTCLVSCHFVKLYFVWYEYVTKWGLLLITQKPVKRQVWWKRRFALFQMQATMGGDRLLVKGLQSVLWQSVGKSFYRLREGDPGRNSTVNSNSHLDISHAMVWSVSS